MQGHRALTIEEARHAFANIPDSEKEEAREAMLVSICHHPISDTGKALARDIMFDMAAASPHLRCFNLTKFECPLYWAAIKTSCCIEAQRLFDEASDNFVGYLNFKKDEHVLEHGLADDDDDLDCFDGIRCDSKWEFDFDVWAEARREIDAFGDVF